MKSSLSGLIAGGFLICVCAPKPKTSFNDVKERRRPFLIGSLAIIAFAGCLAPEDGVDRSGTESGALIGGQPASSTDFPSTVLIMGPTIGNCTAAKVGPRQFLTAAHCVHKKENNTLSPDYQPGSFIGITTAKKVTSANRAAVTQWVEVKSTVMHPGWAEACGSGCNVNVLGPDVPPDVAVVTLAEDTPKIPAAKVDLHTIGAGEGVIVTGYGCTKSVNTPHADNYQQLRFDITKAIAGDALNHPGSFVPSGDPRHDLVVASYVITPGNLANAQEASLCPGDSGGPLYRADGTQSIVVGVNAYYTFKDGTGISMTNWHTRLDVRSRFQIGQWLRTLGVQLIETLPGTGAMQSQSDVIINNGQLLLQSFWRGNQGWLRSVPIVNGNLDLNNAGAWGGPIDIGILPGSGDMQSQSDVIINNGQILLQSFWRGNQGWLRSVPIVGGQLDSNNAGAWGGPITL
jgi:hypothetical protein